MRRVLSVVAWGAVALLGAVAFAVISLSRGEQLSAAWILAAALCTWALGYRFYGKWIATKVLVLDDRRATPCEIHEDGRDFVRTNRWIVFGHHFAAISGPGPLVGPVLAAQLGYLPGTLWILAGVVMAGAVQDFFILVSSMRRDGKSLGEMVKEEISAPAGFIALVAIVSIIVILIAVLGLVVVKALAHSPWGTFTIAATMPIAMAMGIYLRFFRPGKVLEVSLFGVGALLLAVWGGRYFYEVPALSRLLTLDASTLAWCLIGYGMAASILPVWLLLAPRDYLSTFMKLGTILALALGILLVMPPLVLPPLTRFMDGTGPVFSGDVFPFCFITIACGAISGFHSLVASGTTPRLITRESYALSIGYGSMILESAVAIMAVIAAATLEPGVYFAINSPAAAVGASPEAAVATISSWGFPVSVAQMQALAQDLGEETMFGRAGGAPTLAVGMAHIFSQVLGGKGLMALWYHFAIMFEALFILTTVDAGTRVGRFLLQAFLGQLWKPLGNTQSYGANILASSLLVGGWGYFMYQGVIDPQGGINSLWPLFGVANQLLAVIALSLATTLLIKLGRTRQVWVSLLPLSWVSAVTFTAGLEKIFHSSPKVGFLAGAAALSQKLEAGLIPAKDLVMTERQIFNLHLNAVVAGIYLTLVGAILLTSLWRWLGLWSGRQPLTVLETPIVWREALEEKARLNPRPPMPAHVLLLVLTFLRQLVGQGGAEAACVGHEHASRLEGQVAGEGGSVVNEGAAWAAREARRAQRPRCC